MVKRMVSGKALPLEVRQQMVAKTDGVPLFVEELTKMVLESAWLREREGHYELTEPLPSLAIPAMLHDWLMARLDRLASVKEVAQLGATLGRTFSYELLQAPAAGQRGIAACTCPARGGRTALSAGDAAPGDVSVRARPHPGGGVSIAVEGMPVNRVVGDRTGNHPRRGSGYLCCHLRCLLCRLVRCSRDERPGGSPPAFAWDDVACRLNPIRRVTDRPSLAPSSSTRSTLGGPYGMLSLGSARPQRQPSRWGYVVGGQSTGRYLPASPPIAVFIRIYGTYEREVLVPRGNVRGIPYICSGTALGYR
jgi:hypothetical protein